MAENVIVMGERGKRSVDESARLLKRFYLVERELMRVAGGYLVSISNWECKTKLPHHIWQDSVRADAWRTRILEMRYPRRDVDQDHDEWLSTYLSLLIRCAGDAELLTGVYFVTKQALYSAYKQYLETSDELDDAPTLTLLNRFIPEIRQQIAEAEELYQGLPDLLPEAIADWSEGLEISLTHLGGISGSHTHRVMEKKEMFASAVLQRQAYVPPSVPVRDPRFLKAKYHYPPRTAAKFIERQVWAGINHVNEIWAAEIPCVVMWLWQDMPWEFYMDCSRWAYDESRHTLMGERRLRSWGFETGVDYPVCADHYEAAGQTGELNVLALLYAFEINGPLAKSKMKQEFETLGDSSSSTDFDFDWADESIHLAYGHKWVLHRLGGDMDKLEDLRNDVMEHWNEWIKVAREEWDYQPFLNRIDARIAVIEGEHIE